MPAPNWFFTKKQGKIAFDADVAELVDLPAGRQAR
jgi:hypothetical protein